MAKRVRLPGMRTLIDKAVRAERERCATIAESVVVGKPTYLRGEHRKPKSPSLTRQAIAAAIREEPVSVQRPAITVRECTESEQNAGETGYKDE